MTAENKGRVLGKFTIHRSGNSLSLTVPASAGVPEGKKYILVLTDDGNLEYRAIHNNPWLDGDYADIDFRAELAKNGNCGLEKSVGNEKIQPDKWGGVIMTTKGVEIAIDENISTAVKPVSKEEQNRILKDSSNKVFGQREVQAAIKELASK